MSGIYIPSDKIPTKCWGCTFRDPEYGGDCVLMPSFDAGTYEEQLERCPFKEILKWVGAAIPPHGRLIDADALGEMLEKYKTEYALKAKEDIVHLHKAWGLYEAELMAESLPTIIPADPADQEAKA